MSSFIAKFKHPQTGKVQKVFCIDDYFGQHRYGYWFKKDGKDVEWSEFEPTGDEYDIFNEDEIGERLDY